MQLCGKAAFCIQFKQHIPDKCKLMPSIMMSQVSRPQMLQTTLALGQPKLEALHVPETIASDYTLTWKYPNDVAESFECTST